MPDTILPISSATAPRYRYYTADIITNSIIGELAIEDVNYQLGLKTPGVFDGKITITEQTNSLDLYNCTLPGKTAIYVVRDGVCVWGGIIWGRTYDMVSRSLTLSASEFTSYLNHRMIWKAYSQTFEAELDLQDARQSSKKPVFVSAINKSLIEPPTPGEKVNISFLPSKLRRYTGDYTVIAADDDYTPSDAGVKGFYVSMPKLPIPESKKYSQVTVTLKMDTYSYLRDLITNTLNDFSYIQFPNEEITPGIKVPITVTHKKLDITDEYNGIATLTTAERHNLVLGQRVEIVNVDFLLDGVYGVTEIPSPTTFRYELKNPVSKFDQTSPIILSNIDTTPVSTQKTPVEYRQISQYLTETVTHIKRVYNSSTNESTITLRLKSAHRFEIGDKVIISIAKAKPAIQREAGKDVNSFDFSKFNNTVLITDITSDTISFLDPQVDNPDHRNIKYNVTDSSDPENFARVEDESKNSVKSAAPKVLLKVFPSSESTGYAIGEKVLISNVDGFTTPWVNPIFDGYSEIYEVSGGTSHAITNYKIIVNPDILDANVYQTDTLVYIYFGLQDPKIKGGDRINISGLTVDNSSNDISALNGLRVVEEDSAPDASQSNRYYIYFRMPWATIGFTSVVTGGTASVDGKSWIAYEPAYSEIKYDVNLKEPDAISSIKSMQYTPNRGNTPNKVIINTKTRHNLNAGDIVSVKYAKSDDQKNYGASYVRVLSVSDLNTFTYSVPKGAKSPKKEVELNEQKSGSVVRLKSSVGAPSPTKTNFSYLRAQSTGEGGIVTVHSPDHAFAKGDSVIIDVDDDQKVAFENEKEPVVITGTTVDTFTYNLDNQLPPDDDNLEVRGLGFTTDTDGQEVAIINIVEKGSPVSARTESITAVKAKYFKTSNNEKYITYTSSTSPTAALVGDKVTISGFVDANVTSSSVDTTLNISSLKYYATGQNAPSLAITFSSEHGLGLNSGSRESNAANPPYRVKISTFPTTIDVKIDGSTSTTKRNLKNALISGTRSFPISEVVDSKTVLVRFPFVNVGRNFSFDSVGAISGATAKVTDSKRVALNVRYLKQFNGSGTVAYVSGSTFAVRYEFLSGKSGNGVNPYDANGTTYSVSGVTAKFAATSISNITAGSVIQVAGLTEYKQNKSTTYAYSRYNGTHVVKKVVNGSNYSDGKSSRKVYVVNKIRTLDGKSIAKYPNYPPGSADGFLASYTDAYKDPARGNSIAKAFINRWEEVSGTAAIDYLTTSPTSDVYSITSVSRSNSTPARATITTSGHEFQVNDFAEISLYGKSAAAFSQQGNPLRVLEVVDDNVFVVQLNTTTKIVYYSVKNNVVTLYFTQAAKGHNLVVGDTISVSGVATAVNGSRVVTSTGADTISYRVTTANVNKTPVNGTISLTTAINFSAEYSGYAVPGAFIKRVPTVFSRTFGEFPRNAGIGDFEYSTQEYSGNSALNTPILGSSLNTVASILDKYSNGINGFEYRVDCNLEYDANGNKNFTKTFVLVPIYPVEMTAYLDTLPNKKLAVGQWAPPSAFGADKIVFEYPGNISNVNMTESAQDSATRMFVSSGSGDSGGVEAKYSAASDTDLLAAGWPLLDKKESITYPQQSADKNKTTDEFGNYDIETDLHKSATRFLKESKPPQGDIVITVNGSLTPVVGSYKPGNWCSIIINDNFVKNRLNSPLEPRKDVIVRKIDAIRVQVPNNPAFPEMIDLTLVPDWQVDTVGK